MTVPADRVKFSVEDCDCVTSDDYTPLQYNAAMYRQSDSWRQEAMKKNARSRIVGILACIWLVSSCIPNKNHQDMILPNPTSSVPGNSSSGIQVYFTYPGTPASMRYEAGPDENLADAIDSSRLTVDVAIYNLNLWSIRNALIRAHNRGVIVRVVAESDNLGGAEFQELITAGIPVIGDRRESSMHNKFVVIDRNEVWTGSMNFTLTGAYEDNNDLLRVRSSKIAEDYLVEFVEMFEGDMFGDDELSLTPFPKVQIGDAEVEVYFSPDDGVQTHLVELLEDAAKSIYFLAYVFTADELGNIIRDKAAEGIEVAGVMDGGQGMTSTGTELDDFLLAGIDIRLDGIDGLMHHKLIIIDERIVITGSYNFSRNAEEKNDENVLVIHDPEIASIYLQEFWHIYTQSPTP